jgi:hypothetical protein
MLALPLALAAEAQTLRSAVVPADAAVVIPPRGQLVPSPRAPGPVVAAPAAPLAAAPPLPQQAAPTGLAGVSAALVPLAAAALLGVGLPGGSGAASAPATTR